MIMSQIQRESANEQLETAIDSLAQAVACYHNSLTEAGVPGLVVHELTLQFAEEYLEVMIFSRLRAAAAASKDQ